MKTEIRYEIKKLEAAYWITWVEIPENEMPSNFKNSLQGRDPQVFETKTDAYVWLENKYGNKNYILREVK